MSQNELQRVVAEMRAMADAVMSCAPVTKERKLRDWASRIESAQAVAPGGGEVCRWFADGPEASFFAQEHAHAENLIIRAGFDRDEWTITDLTAAPASEAVETARIGDFGIHGLAARIGVRYAADESCSLGAPFYAFSEDELDKFAEAIRSAANTTHWQSNMTADDTTGKCCAFMGTERCSCGRASEAKEHDEHCDFMAFSTGNPECTCKPDDFHRDGRDNKRQPQGTTPGSSPGYSRPSHHTDRFELDEGDRMTLRCALVSFSEELKRDGLGTDDHGVRMTAAYLARISRLLTRINNSAAECKTCNGLGIVGGVRGQTPESMEQVTENCPDCSDVVTAGGTSTSDDELPGMWSRADFTGGATDAEQEQAVEGERKERNRAAEWGEYLAKGAERVLDSINAYHLTCEEYEYAKDGDAVSQAEESLSEAMDGLRSDIYEFRKRADRKPANYPPKFEQNGSETIDAADLIAASSTAVEEWQPTPCPTCGDFCGDIGPTRVRRNL